MLRANQAVRLGLRAASRNPELAFGKALLDLAGTLIGLLPVLWAGALLLRAFGDERAGLALAGLAAGLRALQWPLAGAVLAGAALSWTLSTGFWAGALPVLAADAELQQRPPRGTFLALAFRGFPRVAGASAVASGLSLLVSLALTLALSALPLALALRPSAAMFAAGAALLAAALLLGLLVDLLGRLVLIRSAALGDGATAAFGRAASLLSARLGSCLVVALAFFVLELLVATGGGAVAGFISAGTGLGPASQLVSLAPRAALAMATGAIFAWLETGRQAALAALAADAEGLIELPPEEEPAPRAGYRIPEPWELRPQRPAPAPRAPEGPQEPVVEALPWEPVVDALPAEPVVEALPAGPEVGDHPAEPVVDALPVPEEPPDGAGGGSGPGSREG